MHRDTRSAFSAIDPAELGFRVSWWPLASIHGVAVSIDRGPFLNAFFPSFLREFASCGICCANCKWLKVARALAAFLKSFDEGRRLRLRCWDALRRRLQGGLFSNKKGEWLNPLKSLNPKRQIQTVNRQECAIYRQKVLALLSFVCQSAVC
jgi:hypothetical protein